VIFIKRGNYSCGGGGGGSGIIGSGGFGVKIFWKTVKVLIIITITDFTSMSFFLFLILGFINC
jgi:hypothetical protein